MTDYQIRKAVPSHEHGPIVERFKATYLREALDHCESLQRQAEPGERLYVTFADQPGCREDERRV